MSVISVFSRLFRLFRRCILFRSTAMTEQTVENVKDPEMEETQAKKRKLDDEATDGSVSERNYHLLEQWKDIGWEESTH